MAEHVKQHIIPVLYMKNFSTNDRAFYYSKIANKILKGNINDIAEENNYYTLDGTENKFDWELYYTEIREPEFKEILDLIIDKCTSNTSESFVLDDSLIKRFSEELYYQLLRCEYSRKYSREKVINKDFDYFVDILCFMLKINEKLRMRLISKYPELIKDDEIDINCVKRIVNDLGKNAYMEVATGKIETENLFNIFINRKYVFYKIDFDEHYLTCDDPVMFMNINNYNASPFRNGLVDIDTAIIFPLTPKIIACSYHENNSLFSPINKCLLLNDNKENRKFIENINKSIFIHGRNFVISDDETILTRIMHTVNC